MEVQSVVRAGGLTKEGDVSAGRFAAPTAR